MTHNICYTIFDTPLGWMGLSGSAAGLRQVILPQASPEAVQHFLLENIAETSLDTLLFADLPHRLRRYFQGEKVDFADPVDLGGATPFQQAVWEITRSIPYGETRRYSWVAQQSGMSRAARAVGQALSRNPLPLVIPCHRVVAAAGPGGYTGGLELKSYLLKLEARTRQGSHRTDLST